MTFPIIGELPAHMRPTCECGSCRKCRRREYMRVWRAANPERNQRYYNPSYDRDYNLRKKYGLLGTAFQVMFDEQGGLCAICRSGPATCVDHVHETGEVRALLCRPCNAGLGQFAEEPGRLRQAADYLERFTVGA